jgi:hypothetical protein
MQYSPKLKKAMEEIKAIVKKYDVAAFVVLHDPKGFTEYLNHVSPSYSCISFENGELRVRLKEAEVGRQKAKQLAEDTFNMVAHFVEMIGKHALMYIEMEKYLKNHWNGEEGDSTHTSHEQQNN